MPSGWPFSSQQGTNAPSGNPASSSSRMTNTQPPQCHHQHENIVYIDEKDSNNQDSTAREGKFSELSKFLVIPEGETAPALTPKPASLADLKPGQITYIHDQSSRLDRRVMLVLRKPKRSGITCLTFCHHHCDLAELEDHWGVCGSEPARGSEEFESLTSLQVILKPHYHNAKIYQPQRDITINIWDIWNVENTVNVVVLGRADGKSMRSLAEEVVSLFETSVEEDVRRPGGDLRLSPAHGERADHKRRHSQVEEQRNGKAKAGLSRQPSEKKSSSGNKAHLSKGFGKFGL